MNVIYKNINLPWLTMGLRVSWKSAKLKTHLAQPTSSPPSACAGHDTSLLLDKITHHEACSIRKCRLPRVISWLPRWQQQTAQPWGFGGIWDPRDRRADEEQWPQPRITREHRTATRSRYEIPRMCMAFAPWFNQNSLNRTIVESGTVWTG